MGPDPSQLSSFLGPLHYLTTHIDIVVRVADTEASEFTSA